MNVFTIAFLSVLFIIAAIAPYLGLGHNMFAGLHLLAAARNINYTPFLTPFTWYYNSDNYSIYNHHPPLFFLAFGFIARLVPDKFNYLLLSRLICSILQLIGSIALYLGYRQVLRQSTEVTLSKSLLISSFVPLCSINFFLLAGLTTFDTFSYPLTSIYVSSTFFPRWKSRVQCIILFLFPLFSYQGIIFSCLASLFSSIKNFRASIKRIYITAFSVLIFLAYHILQTYFSVGLNNSRLISRLIFNTSSPPERVSALPSFMSVILSILKGFVFFVPLPIIFLIVLIYVFSRFYNLSIKFKRPPSLSNYSFNESLLIIFLAPIIFTVLTPYWSAFHPFSWLIIAPCFSFVYFCIMYSFYANTHYQINKSLHFIILNAPIVFSCILLSIYIAPKFLANSSLHILNFASPPAYSRFIAKTGFDAAYKCDTDNVGTLAFYGSWPSSIILNDHDRIKSLYTVKLERYLTPFTYCIPEK